MTAHLELGTMASELVSVLATQTGLAVGDAVSPVSGEPALSDYPYVVVYEISDVEQFEFLPAPSTTMMVYQCTCVGRTPLQARRARDFCKAILDPSITVETTTARMLDRRTIMSGPVDPSGAAKTWSAIWRFECLVTAI